MYTTVQKLINTFIQEHIKLIKNWLQKHVKCYKIYK